MNLYLLITFCIIAIECANCAKLPAAAGKEPETVPAKVPQPPAKATKQAPATAPAPVPKTYQTIQNLKKFKFPQPSSSSKSSKIVFVSGSSKGNDGWSASTAKVLSKLIKVVPTNSFPTLSITEDEMHGVAPPEVALEAAAEQEAFEQAQAAAAASAANAKKAAAATATNAKKSAAAPTKAKPSAAAANAKQTAQAKPKEQSIKANKKA